MKTIFSKKDYNSPDGMLTSVWGPPMWHVLHTISFNYPIEPTKDDKDNYYNFFKNIKNTLPCKYCRINLNKNLKKVKMNKSIFKNRDSLSRWVYELHEEVNKMLNKKSNLTYCQVKDRYEHFRARCLNQIPGVESGCTDSLYGMKSKCVLNIVPKELSCETFKIDKKCKLKRK